RTSCVNPLATVRCWRSCAPKVRCRRRPRKPRSPSRKKASRASTTSTCKYIEDPSGSSLCRLQKKKRKTGRGYPLPADPSLSDERSMDLPFQQPATPFEEEGPPVGAIDGVP